MSLRISYDHQIFLVQKFGGVSRYYFEISNRIAAAGHNVQIFSPFYVNKYFSNDCIVRPSGIRIPRFPPILRLIPKAVNFILSYLIVNFKRDIDIFHQTYYSMLNFHPKSAKLVVTVYDMIHEKFSVNFSKYNLIQKFKAKAVKQADHVICISESTRRDLISLLETPFEKTSVIHLGSSLTGTHVSSKRPDTKKPYILYVGSRSGYKNFEGLLRAFSQSSQLKKKFMLLCFGGGKFNLHELNLIKLLKLNEDDILILSGDDELLASLYTFASAFVCPSLYEGFGLSSLEAMRFGCPVVCANSSSLPEVVGGAAEFFDPENFSEIQFALEQVVFSPQRSKRLVDLGYERAKLFSWDECARRTLDVYNSILEK